MIDAKRIHEFDPLSNTEITADTVFEVEKPSAASSFFLLETGDNLLLETGDKMLLESSGTGAFKNFKVTYADLLARIIADIP